LFSLQQTAAFHGCGQAFCQNVHACRNWDRPSCGQFAVACGLVLLLCVVGCCGVVLDTRQSLVSAKGTRKPESTDPSQIRNGFDSHSVMLNFRLIQGRQGGRLESTKKLNFFPKKKGVSEVFSPRMIMHQENLDHERHCKHQIGERVQAHDEPKFANANAPRSLDCICLRPMDNAQGGHELLHLQTNQVVKRRKLTKIPMPPSIVKQSHALAVLDDMPLGLKKLPIEQRM
jgi:hypothetical protein